MDNFLKLSFVFIVAFVMRFYLLTEYPVSLSMDEVNIGYNAYSILETGKDEHGELLPLAFRSVGDYKPPVNIYLTAISIWVFGLTEFAVRFPTAILGALTAPVLALLLKELKFKQVSYLAAGLWLAILPWHIHFSRGGFEAVTALFLLILGTLFYIRGSNNKSYLLVGLSVASFSISVWSYHSARFFVPLLFLFLVWIYRANVQFFLKNNIKHLMLIVIVGLIFALPFIHLTLFTPAISTRALSTSIFREFGFANTLHNGVYNSIGEFIFDHDIYKIFHHFAGKYLNYFDLEFWFWDGMQFTAPGKPDSGLFYLVNAPLILFGIYSLFISKDRKLKALGLFWFFTGPIPASFTMNEQHPLRALVWIPFFAFAFASAIEKLKVRKIFILVYFLLLSINIVYFADIYFRQFPRFSAEYWQYGYEQVVRYACENKDDYEKIYITDTFGSLGPLNTGTPYAYALFYCGIDPIVNLETREIHNLNFTRLTWESDAKLLENSLIISAPWDFPPVDELGSKLRKVIYYPNGIPAFYVVEP